MLTRPPLNGTASLLHLRVGPCFGAALLCYRLSNRSEFLAQKQALRQFGWLLWAAGTGFASLVKGLLKAWAGVLALGIVVLIVAALLLPRTSQRLARTRAILPIAPV